jgi:hypothetical protein
MKGTIALTATSSGCDFETASASASIAIANSRPVSHKNNYRSNLAPELCIPAFPSTPMHSPSSYPIWHSSQGATTILFISTSVPRRHDACMEHRSGKRLFVRITDPLMLSIFYVSSPCRLNADCLVTTIAFRRRHFTTRFRINRH